MNDKRRSERILVVDDEAANLKLLDRMLQSEGYHEQVLVEDPRQALTRYRETRPDLILLDISMPHLDGFGVLERLQALGDPLLPPVVVLTAQQGRDHLLRALAEGARDYITKPFDRSELLMRVRNLLDAQLAHRLVHDQKTILENMVNERTDELRRTRLQVVQRLGMAAEYRDEETGNHILRMSYSSALLASALGWGDYDCDLLLNASPMHDVGKIGIPDAILLKPGRLDPDEWAIMKTHAAIGGKLLEGDDSDLMRLARDIALTHHEKWDGRGYPRGFKGTAIPQAGRIAAVADVLDALTSARTYKAAWPVDRAVDLVKEKSGSHFDPEVVEILLQELDGILDIRKRFDDSQGAG